MVRDITDSDPGRSGRGRRTAVIAGAAIILGILVLAQQRPSVSLPAPRAGPPPQPRSVGLLAMDARGFSEGWLATGTNLPPWQLWHTGDGGNSWKGSLSMQATTGFFDRVHFFDDRRGYLLILTPAFDLKSNTLLVTTDGGASWEWRDFPKPSGMVLGDLSMTAAGEGRALFSAGTNGDFGNPSAALYATHDGYSWTVAAQVDSEHVASNGLSLQGSKGPMAFVDAEHGVILSQGPGRFGVYSTADGGGAWSFHALELPSSDLQSTPSAASSLTAVDGQLLLGVAFRQSTTPAASAVYRSLDGGASWSNPIEVPTTDGAAAPVFTGSQVWWVPDGTAVELTTDGGGNWIRSELHLTGTTRVKSVYSVDDRRAWAFAGGSFGPPTLLYETTDGGATWSIRKPPV